MSYPARAEGLVNKIKNLKEVKINQLKAISVEDFLEIAYLSVCGSPREIFVKMKLTCNQVDNF